MNLTVFGDSVGVGQQVSPHLAWVTLVSAELPDVLVTNASRNGDTTRTALVRMAHDVPESDVLVVQFGLNDANIWASEFGSVRVTEASFMADLAEIAYRARRARLILATNHRTRRDPDYDARVRRYNDLIRTSARALDAELVDIEHVEVDLLRGGIHPSAEGHRAYFAAMLPAIRAALGR